MNSQVVDAVFKEASHYFGTFSKSKGKVAYTFEFTNVGDKPVIVTRVKASCGCTATKYERQPVMPGGWGYVTVTFDPAKFSGYFSKKVSVYFEGVAEPEYLTISGRIRVNHSVQDSFKYFIGDLRADNNNVDMGDVKAGTERRQEIKFINVMRDSVYVKVIKSPQWVEAQITKADLAAGDNARLLVSKSSNPVLKKGAYKDSILLKVTRGVRDVNVKVPIYMGVIDDFAVLTENTPKIGVDSSIYVKKKQGGKFKLKIQNYGQSDLHVYDVEHSQDDLKLIKYNEIIKPGSKGTVVMQIVQVNALAEPLEIRIWNNDPENYKPKIHIREIAN